MALSACGGGGGGGGTSKGFDPSPFYGVWLPETNYCGSNVAVNVDGITHYSAYEKFVRISESQYEITADLYQGLDCKGAKIGSLILATAIKWSLATIVGKSTAARILVNSNDQVTATMINGNPIELKPSSSGETTEKTVLAVENNVIYAGDNSSTGVFDADGYPTTIVRYGFKQ